MDKIPEGLKGLVAMILIAVVVTVAKLGGYSNACELQTLGLAAIAGLGGFALGNIKKTP